MAGVPDADDLQRFELQPEPGHRLVGDHAPGAAPGYLFLHGLGSVRAGEKSAALLAHARRQRRALTRFDFRGHGESSGRIGHATIGELIADTGKVLDRFGPAIIVGSSLGGLVAAFVAAARPAQVRGLALLAPALGLVHRLEQWVGGTGMLRTTDGREFPVHERVVQDAHALDEAGLPGRLPMPVLVVHGSADDVIPSRRSERFFAAVPHHHKDLWLVPGGDHRLNREIARILERLDALLG